MKQSTVWAAILWAKRAALVWAGASVMLACSSSSSASGEEALSPKDLIYNPASAEGSASEAGPKLVWVDSTYAFGKVTSGDTVRHRFRFVNQGQKPLLVQSVVAGCACTASAYTESPIAPGDSGFVEATIHTENLIGEVSKTLDVVTNAVPGHRRLVLNGTVEGIPY